MRVVFFGTPPFAVPSLQALASAPAVTVPLVVSQPDRPSGRGHRSQSPAVVEAARELGLPVYQTASLRTPEARAPLVAAEADLFVVAAFGLIFGRSTLTIPPLGCVNVHASLLPRYRGASPVAAAIWSGDEETGVTLMRMEAGLDTGPILATTRETIAPDDTTESLSARLGAAGSSLLRASVPSLAAGGIAPIAQPIDGASLTRPLTKEDGWIDWRRSARGLERHVRAMWAWPRAWTTLGGEPLQVHRVAVLDRPPAEEPGRVFPHPDAVGVVCGDGGLLLVTVQPAGGKPMSGAEFARGRLGNHVRLGDEGAPIALPPLITPVGPG